MEAQKLCESVLLFSSSIVFFDNKEYEEFSVEDKNTEENHDNFHSYNESNSGGIKCSSSRNFSLMLIKVDHQREAGSNNIKINLKKRDVEYKNFIRLLYWYLIAIHKTSGTNKNNIDYFSDVYSATMTAKDQQQDDDDDDNDDDDDDFDSSLKKFDKIQKFF